MKKTAVVLNELGDPWGVVNTDEKNGGIIDVFSVATTDGEPVNVQRVKISRSMAKLEELLKDPWGGKTFTEYHHKGFTYYQFIEEGGDDDE